MRQLSFIISIDSVEPASPGQQASPRQLSLISILPPREIIRTCNLELFTADAASV